MIFPALLAALAIGASDYLGGVSARRMPLSLSLALTLAAGLLAIPRPRSLLAAPFDIADVTWGCLAGLGTLAGLALLRAALARTAMIAIAPTCCLVTALVCAAYHALVHAVAPRDWAGLALGASALALLARSADRSALLTAAAAGAGFALGTLGFVHMSAGAGPWPIFIALLLRFGIAVIVTRPVLARESWEAVSQREGVWQAIVAGVLAIFGNSCIAEAVKRGGDLHAVGAVASQHCVVTVALAAALLGEPPSRRQLAGLACGAVSLLLLGQPA